MKTDEINETDAKVPGVAKPVQISVTVNQKPVTFGERRVSGMQLKEGAIAQGVNIQRDFVLFEVKGKGNLKPVADEEMVTLNKGDEFRAVDPDDNS